MLGFGGERGIRTLGIGFPIHWFSKPIWVSRTNPETPKKHAVLACFIHRLTRTNAPFVTVWNGSKVAHIIYVDLACHKARHLLALLLLLSLFSLHGGCRGMM